MQIIPMTPEHAEHISLWTYEGEYSFYDHSPDSADSLLDGTHYACLDDDGDLAAYFCFGVDAQVPTVEENVYPQGYLDFGIGLKPELCGKGNGLIFVRFGIAYATEAFDTRQFRLSVADFNKRAIKVYQRAGFATERMVTNSYFKNLFQIMTLRLPA